MMKELSEMTLEELWILFPIVLKAHNADYKNWYIEEKQTLLAIISEKDLARIHHIGSSAVEGLVSKPTVDILLELAPNADVEQIIKLLEAHGWGLMSNQRTPHLNLTFNKGYTKYGFAEKVYHLHVRFLGDWSELYFRDYLIDHPEVAKAYGELKLTLGETYRNNRDGYTEAKSEFIKTYTDKARQIYSGRYEVSQCAY